MIETFTTTGTSATGISLEATITDTRVSDGDTASLLDETRFLDLSKGRSDHVRIEPMVACEATLSVLRTAPVEQLTDADEEEVEISLVRQDSGAEVFKGYFVPRRYEDRPFLPHDDVVSLTFDEGLPTLKGKSFGDMALTSRHRVRIITVIREVLNNVYDTALPLDIGMGWWPKSSLSTSDLPLQYTWLDPDNFRQERPDGDEWQSQFRVLKSIFQAFGFVCRQTYRGGRLAWHIRQPYALTGTGDIEMWTVTPSGQITHQGQVDLSEDITTKIDSGEIRRDHSRTFEEARQRVAVTHDHAAGADFIREGGFEEQGRFWNNIAAGVSFLPHNTESKTPSGQPENQVVGKMSYDSDTGSGAFNIQLEQINSIVRPDARDSLQFSLNSWSSLLAATALRVKIGTAELDEEFAKVQFGASPDDSQILVEQLQDTVYEGQTLMVSIGNVVPQPEAYFEVEETAQEGDTVVRGQLSSSVPQGSYLVYPRLKNEANVSSPFLLLNAIPEEERETWSQTSIQFSATDGNGDRLQGKEVEIGLGFKETEDNAGIHEFYFDDLSLEPFRNGQPMSSTLHAADVDSSGQEDDISTRVGSGPGEGSISRVFGQGIYDARFPILSCDKATNQVVVEGDARNILDAGIRIVKHEVNGGEYSVTGSVTYDSATDTTTLDDVLGDKQLQDFGEQGYAVTGLQSEFSAFQWGTAPSGAGYYPLGELLARQRLRYFRTQSERYEIEPVPPDDPLLYHGHEVIVIDGTTYTISSLSSRPSTAERPITILENSDAGTA